MAHRHTSGVSVRRYRHALLASAASLAALAGILLAPAVASARPVTVGAAADPVTITASFAQPTVNAASTDLLSGSASYMSGDSSYPLADTTLTITSPAGNNWAAVSTTVTTAADGSFSYVTPQIPLLVTSIEFTVSSAATSTLEAGQVSLTLPVNQLVQISFFGGHLNAHRVVRLSACAGIPQQLADSVITGSLYFQYSASRRGPWKTLGVGNGPSYDPCAEYGGSYSATFTAPQANGYYRAYVPSVPGEMSALSNVIHRQRYPTRITGFAVSPRLVGRGGKVTVSGRLWHLDGTWRADARSVIVIEYRYRGKTYTLKQRLTTNSAGRFRGVFAVPHTAAWQAVYGGGGSDLAVTSRAISIRVR
jgi:hypothetical protein